MKPTLFITCTCLLSAFLLSGCSKESAWQNAEKQNTAPVYEAFIRKYPDDEHSTIARERIELMKFEQAKSAGEATGLEAYLAAYPTGRYADEANRLLAPLVFKSAGPAGSVVAYERFLNRFPQSDLAGEATSRLRKLRYEAATGSPTLVGHVRFIQQYPKGTDSDELRKSLQTLPKWEESEKLGELILRLSPKTLISMSMSTGSGGVGLGPASLTTEKPTGEDADMAKVRQLLAEGAVPAAVRVAGFEPGGKKDMGNGMMLMSSGSPGHIVPADQDGMTLLEYCRANKLDAISALLKAQGAN
jgi:hypothetical protein